MTVQTLDQLRQMLADCGLPSDEVRSYISLFADDPDHLPSPLYPETLTEAQRIRNLIAETRPNYPELGACDVHRFLNTPYGEWLLAKQIIGVRLSLDQEEMDALYEKDPDWLFVREDEACALIDFLKSRFGDFGLVKQIFWQAALLGYEASKSRIDAILDMLGQETGTRFIITDIRKNGWLFYRYYSDPVGAVRYMLQCGMTAEQVLHAIEQDSFILYAYKQDRRRSYNHDQQWIDDYIRHYM